ncbi:C39 family peptidase [Lachnospiraceae bacterium KK002]
MRQGNAKRRRERRRRKIRRMAAGMGMFLILAAVLPAAGRIRQQGSGAAEAERCLQSLKEKGEDYPQELEEMLEHNPETADFVAGYPSRADYLGKEIDLTSDYQPGQVPLLMQWDRRWGYDSYGQEMVGVAGCGPTCMTMAYLYLTGDTAMNPRKMAAYAYDSGFYTEAGTGWDFFIRGAGELGLSGRELPLGETQIKQALDQGGLVICSMRPGDFTTTGHFILLRSYDDNGFYVNDPNSRENSEKQWDFDTLSPQIKCLWNIM